MYFRDEMVQPVRNHATRMRGKATADATMDENAKRSAKTMSNSSYYDWDPITQNDAGIEAALEHAISPVMLASLACLTGDLDLLQGDIQINMEGSDDLQCGISEDQQSEVRRMALEALSTYRDRGCPTPAQLDSDAIRKILRFMTGEELGDDYVQFLTEESEFASNDAYGLEGFESIPDSVKQDFNVVIVGAGMSGLLAGYRLKQAGIAFTIIERSAEVGGTWHNNLYPGCRVDNPSRVYEYSFARHDWPQYFCSRSVLHDYFSRCATDFGLRPHIRFEHEVEGAEYDEASGTWSVRISDKHGVTNELKANAFICAVGQLNQPRLPDIEGRDDFEGPAFHTAQWDTSVDLTGKRVAVIGTGASAMQMVPEVAKQASEMVVFQRTPPWIYPTENYRTSVPDGEHWLINHVPYYARWYHFLLFWLDGEGLHASATRDLDWPHQEQSVSQANQDLRDFMIDSIKQVVGDDNALVETATPKHPPIGKRMLVDDGTWYRALMRDDVNLTTEPIERITPQGVLMKNGELHDVDVIVFATGFYAQRFMWPMDIKGKGGRDLREHWGDDPRAYLGVVAPGFPNLFCLYGPNTNIVVTGSTIFFSECGMHYILGCLKLLMEDGHSSLECRQDVHDAYNEIIDEGNLQVAWGAPNVRSWYKNKAGRVTQNWPFKLLEYWTRTKTTNPDDFHIQ